MTALMAVPDEARPLDQEGAGLVRTVADLQVVDTATFEQAVEVLKSIKAYLRRVGDVFDPIVEAAHKAHKTAVAQRDALKSHALTAETTIKARVAAYQREQERIRREQEEAARRERARLEREAREAAEAERRRLHAIEEERRLAEAVEAEARGDHAAAERIVAEPVVVETPPPMPVFVPPPVAVQPAARVAGVSFREDWTFEITNAALIPREYLMPDEKRIGGVVRAMKDKTSIPGVRVVAKTTTSVRA